MMPKPPRGNASGFSILIEPYAVRDAFLRCNEYDLAVCIGYAEHQHHLEIRRCV
jgi:hypothetical protein